MTKRSLYNEIEKKEPKSKRKVLYRFGLELYEKDYEHYDFQKMLKWLSLEWGCSMKDVVLISLKDAFNNANKPQKQS